MELEQMNKGQSSKDVRRCTQTHQGQKGGQKVVRGQAESASARGPLGWGRKRFPLLGESSGPLHRILNHSETDTDNYRNALRGVSGYCVVLEMLTACTVHSNKPPRVLSELEYGVVWGKSPFRNVTGKNGGEIFFSELFPGLCRLLLPRKEECLPDGERSVRRKTLAFCVIRGRGLF